MTIRMRLCPTCGRAPEMVQLDSGHWIATCAPCYIEVGVHWSKVAARQMWNGYVREREALRAGRRTTIGGSVPV